MHRLWMFCLTALLLADSSRAEVKAQRERAASQGPVEAQADSIVASIPIFDGAVMTRQRAAAMAKVMNSELLSFRSCAYHSGKCVMMEVVAPNKKAYLYQISSERCLVPVDRSIDNSATDQDMVVGQSGPTLRRPRGPEARQRRVVGDPGLPNTGAQPDQPWVDSRPPGSASYCFAGYRADYRVRQDNLLYADHTGYALEINLAVQLIDNGYWKDAMTSTTSAWDLLKPDSQLNNKGKAFELRDSLGRVITSESESEDWIAASPPQVGLTERCAAKRDSMQAGAELACQVGFDVCRVATAAIPDSATAGLSLEPLGMGGHIETTKNQDFCRNAKDTQIAISKVASAGMYEDCLENPGRYFPADYPPPDADIDLAHLINFKPFYPKEYVRVTVSGTSCPPTTTEHFSTDMGGGITCDAVVRYTCKSTGGECRCTEPKVVGDLVCTGSGPMPERRADPRKRRAPERQ
jgi:hypothetical protein